MYPEEIIETLPKQYSGLVLSESWGETGLFYNPDRKLKRGVYFLTVKEKDGANDSASNLDRDGIYRVNIGITKETFQKLFTTIPARPKAGGIVDMDFDFTAKDIIMPHPVYGWMRWICVLNPSPKTYQNLRPLLDESYQLVLQKYASKKL